VPLLSYTTPLRFSLLVSPSSPIISNRPPSSFLLHLDRLVFSKEKDGRRKKEKQEKIATLLSPSSTPFTTKEN
jgi:hypothetical protein